MASLRARLLGDDAHLREHVRSGREGTFLCLVVDASGSMGAQRRLARVKGALAGLLRDAYARRDRVAVVAFRDAGAEVLIAPGAPLERAAAALGRAAHRRPHAAGGRAATPRELLVRRERCATRAAARSRVVAHRRPRPATRRRDRRARPRRSVAPPTAVEVVDTEEGPVRLGLAAALAAAAGGRVHRLVPVTAPEEGRMSTESPLARHGADASTSRIAR